MILKQLAMLLATNFLKQSMTQKGSQTNWIADSTKAITYTAVTRMFLTKMSTLLKKSIVVIPLSIFGSVLGVLCYLDLMDLLDNKAASLAPSFVVNSIGFIFCFAIAYLALNSSAKSSDEKSSTFSEVVDENNGELSNAMNVHVKAPVQNMGTQVQENISFFKRGFSQAFEKTHD